MESAKLNRKDLYQLHIDLEQEIEFTPETDLEDVTDLVFSALEHLKDCELLAKP
jgi:hypothetical protein